MSQVDALAVARPLSLTERAVALALAVSLDNDYFSRHSGHSGHGYALVFPAHVLVEVFWSKFMSTLCTPFSKQCDFEFLDCQGNYNLLPPGGLSDFISFRERLGSRALSNSMLRKLLLRFRVRFLTGDFEQVAGYDSV